MSEAEARIIAIIATICVLVVYITGFFFGMKRERDKHKDKDK